MRINHNIPALNSYRNLTGNSSLQAKSMEKLSSGLRINRAADDAAGLAISETMRGQIKGLNQASRNSQDAISLIQTAEGALTETHSILHRMRELSVQSSNDTVTANDRMEVQKEIDQLKDEVDRIANTTTFNNKNLLDGSAAALTSTDKTSTKVFMRGGLRTVDEFGIKSSGAGDFKLTIEATAGQAQIQKSNVFRNNHAGDTVQSLAIDESSGIKELSATNIAHGAYQVQTSANVSIAAIQNASATVAQYFAATGSTAGYMVSGVGVNVAAHSMNASILVEVDDAGYDVNGTTATSVTLKVSWYTYDSKANYLNTSGDWGTTQPIQMNTTTITLNAGQLAGVQNYDLTNGIVITMDVVETGIAIGDKTTINYKSAVEAVGVSGQKDTVTIMNSTDTVSTPVYNNTVVDWAFDNTAMNNSTKSLYFFSLDASGNVGSGNVDLTAGGLAGTTNAATFKFVEGLGQVASLDTELSNIDKFTDANGKFMLDDAQVLTLVQGDGAKTSITLYGTDTLRDVRNKLNEAIAGADGLNQGELVDPNDTNRFVSYVSSAETSGVESGEGTFVIRSAKAGADGEISIIGSEQLINALGLSDTQSSTESKFTVNVTNASTDESIAKDVSIQGNLLIGVVHPNVDVKFDSNANVKVTWDDATKKFGLAGDVNSTYSTNIHLVDNTQVFQIGANQMQDMGSAIGNMNSESLGIKNLIVTDRESAGRAITTLDNAISRVSSQRSTLGAVQNRLEHTINNLGVAGENLTASESRIRDVDMANEMMTFSKFNILSQAATAMMAQANQQPQQVLQLIGR